MENEVNNMEQRKAECLSVLLEKGKTKGNLTYKDISDQVDHIEFDKDQMDEIYETLLGKGFEGTMESEPDDLNLLEIDDEDVDDPDVDAVGACVGL